MSATENGKDCKHEIRPLINNNNGSLYGYICNICPEHFGKQDVVILTKAQHQRIAELEELHPFIKHMIDEVESNAIKKGNWRDWNPASQKEWIDEIKYHNIKLESALRNNNKKLILEYCADIANLAYFVAINSEALQPKDEA